MKQYDSNKNNVKTYYSMAQPMKNFQFLVSFDLTTKKRTKKNNCSKCLRLFLHVHANIDAK